MNDSSNRLRVQPKSNGPAAQWKFPSLLREPFCRASLALILISYKFQAQFPADCGLSFGSGAHVSSQLRTVHRPERSWPCQVFISSALRTTASRDGDFQPTADSSGVHRSSFGRNPADVRLRIRKSFCSLVLRSRLEGIAAVGCKNTRSRLERRPQLAGTDNPQSSGTESAVGWQLARTALEKKPGYLPSF